MGRSSSASLCCVLRVKGNPDASLTTLRSWGIAGVRAASCRLVRLSRHFAEHVAGAGMESSGPTWSFSGRSIADSMLAGASLGVAGGGSGAVGGGVVVVDGDEVTAACWTLNCSHEESKSAAMACSDLYESAISLHESARSWNESLISLHGTSAGTNAFAESMTEKVWSYFWVDFSGF